MRVREIAGGVALTAVTAILLAGAARAADLPEPIMMNAPVAADNPCADARVLGRIRERFDWTERKTWHRGFGMQTIANGRSSGHAYAEPGIIHREYCMADSLMTNGANHTIFYAIEFGQGFASIGNYVDFCVLGLDPWHVHDEACRAVR